MITVRCDGCGKELERGALRYKVKMDVRAAYDELVVGLAELVRDHRAEMLRLIDQLKDKDPAEIEETIYKAFEFDLCPACQRAFIKGPLRFHPEQGTPEGDVDIDAFLRSLRPSNGGEPEGGTA
ncbi:MAG: hypothetical protein GY851_14640 [bacterium]|nr:hypothetical protein [bacterium]